MSNQFVVNRLRKEPVSYTVQIDHYISNGEWMMGVTVTDVCMDSYAGRQRVASDLRRAADMLDSDGDNAS